MGGVRGGERERDTVGGARLPDPRHRLGKREGGKEGGREMGREGESRRDGGREAGREGERDIDRTEGEIKRKADGGRLK